MKWKEYYSSKLVSADITAAEIKSGDRIALGHACAEPRLFIPALLKRAGELKNVRILHGLGMGPGLYCAEEINSENICHNTIFAGANTRKAVHDGRAEFVPMHFSDIARSIKNGVYPVDVAVVTVSPPDKHGYCSFGISIDYARDSVEKAKLVIAEVNENMPRTFGESLVHVSEIDYFIESNLPLLQLEKPNIGPIEESIGKHISELVQDGATLQLGIGAIPNAILGFLKDKNDLGLHSELLSDATLELINEGIINGKAKTIHKGKALATFAAGTPELYSMLDGNPKIEFYPVDYVNDSHIISQNYRMFSVNSALQIDLIGQVNAETIKGKQYSGIGGQMDFVRGATLAKEGKSIIAMPSTAKNGQLSRIVAALAVGDVVTTPRNDVDYVVTEFGAVRLRGQDLKERARLLISIAHPNFRSELKSQFEFIYGFKI